MPMIFFLKMGDVFLGRIHVVRLAYGYKYKIKISFIYLNNKNPQNE